jgi:hypothetical protein
MSNNKQSMKLYTEEQLLNTIKSIRHYDDVYDEKVARERIEKHLKALQPIELPSDEEILSLIGDGMHDYYKGGFEQGAKWMRDKIQGGNK